MEWWIGIVGIAILLGIGATRQMRSQTGLTLPGWFIICLGPGQAVIFTFVVYITKNGENDLWEKWILPYEMNFWLVPCLILLAEIGAWYGAVLSKPKGTFSTGIATKPSKLHRIHILAWVSLLGGIFGLWLYSRAYGGFAGLLAYRTTIYYLGIDIPNPWSFVLRVGGLCCFASLLFTGLLAEEGWFGLRKYVSWFGLILSFLFAMLYWYILAGRLLLATYVTMFLIIYFALKFRSANRLLITSFAGLIAILVVVYWVTPIVDPQKFENTMQAFFAKELSFPTSSLLTTIESNKIRYGIDVLATPLYFLPQRITYSMLGIDTASDANTDRLLGAPKGQGAGYSVPVDALTFGFLQGGIYGVVLLPFVFSYALGWLETFLRQIPAPKVGIVLQVYAGLFVAAMSAFYADPEHIIRRNWHFMVGMPLILFLTSSAHRNRTSKISVESGR